MEMEEIKIPLTSPGTFLLDGIAFKQTPYWFDNIFRDLHMSIIQPWGEPKRLYPVIVWVCGGGWRTMDRSAWLSELSWFAKRGWAVASPEYRTVNEKPLPAALCDIKTAIRYLRSHAKQYGFDPGRIAVMGESAGGHLAALTGLTGDDPRFQDGDCPGVSDRVGAVVDWYGPVSEDILLEHCRKDAAPGDGQALPLSPLQYIDGHTPPFCILHGTEDSLVPIAESERFFGALRSRGVPARFYAVAGAGHATQEFHQDEIKQLILSFLEQSV